MPEVVTLGETMVLFSPDQTGLLRYVHNFEKRIAGSESNLAIGLVRLGHTCGWISQVGHDEFGQFLLREIRAEGVDVSQVKVHTTAPTGIMFKEIHEGSETRVFYYRKGSAASYLSPEDIDCSYIQSARLLHITGITPALSATCLNAAHHAIDLAKSHGITISFDPNIRLKLWQAEEASRVLNEFLPKVDIVLTGLREGEILCGTADPALVIKKILDAGAKLVAIKLGDRGCMVADTAQTLFIEPYKVTREVDPIGAGDAFDAGFLAGYLEGRQLADCGRMANAMGAMAVTSRGDFEGLPSRTGLDAFINGQSGIAR